MSVSGYSAYLQRPESWRAVIDDVLMAHIRIAALHTRRTRAARSSRTSKRGTTESDATFGASAAALRECAFPLAYFLRGVHCVRELLDVRHETIRLLYAHRHSRVLSG